MHDRIKALVNSQRDRLQEVDTAVRGLDGLTYNIHIQRAYDLLQRYLLQEKRKLIAMMANNDMFLIDDLLVISARILESPKGWDIADTSVPDNPADNPRVRIPL